MLDLAQCCFEKYIELQQHPTALHSCGRPAKPTNDNKELETYHYQSRDYR